MQIGQAIELLKSWWFCSRFREFERVDGEVAVGVLVYLVCGGLLLQVLVLSYEKLELKWKWKWKCYL